MQTYSTHLVGEELWVLMEPLDAGSLTQLVENLHIAQLVSPCVCLSNIGAKSIFAGGEIGKALGTPAKVSKFGKFSARIPEI